MTDMLTNHIFELLMLLPIMMIPVIILLSDEPETQEPQLIVRAREDRLTRLQHRMRLLTDAQQMHPDRVCESQMRQLQQEIEVLNR